MTSKTNVRGRQLRGSDLDLNFNQEIDDLGELVEALGTERFGELATDLVKHREPVDFVVINLHDSRYRLQMRLGRLTEKQREVANLVDKHSTFRFDPNSELVQNVGPRVNQVLLNRVKFEDFENKRYHNLFFERFQLIDRLSVFAPISDFWLVSSFYRTVSSGIFSDDEAVRFARLGQMLNQLASKHLGLRHAADLGSGDPARVHAAIQLCQNLLSSREEEVCAGLLAGRTNQQVAGNLNVAVETVRTLRKRAYQKLSVDNLAGLQTRLLARFCC